MRNIFIGPNGIRAGWRLALYIAIVVALAFLIGIVLRVADPRAVAAMKHASHVTKLTPLMTIAGDASIFLLLLIASFIMSKIERRPIGQYGLPARSAFGKSFFAGALWGFLALSALVVVIGLGHGISIAGVRLHGAQIVEDGVLWAIAFAVVGLAEEFSFRGYPQFTLTTGMGFWPAAIVLSLGFLFAHTHNSGESPIGLASVAAAGLLFCFMLQRTGTLWWPVGFHAAWDWAQSFFYGTPDSGLHASGRLLVSHLHGAAWLTGGSDGPEGSAYALIVLALVAVLFHFAYPRTQYPWPPGVQTAER